jgi:lipopolysaccharide/colanic/teichoic acid biosynthesis glycosyltransferase
MELAPTRTDSTPLRAGERARADDHLLPTPWEKIDSIPASARFQLAPSIGWYDSLKPSVEFLVALTILIPALPIIGLAWLLVKWVSPGPGFYLQTRCGRGNRPYRIVKIRTMHHNIEAKTGVQWATQNDPRVFRLGKWLRITHLDELPQLFNVLAGSMTLVGPRPERPEVIESKGLRESVPGYDLRMAIKPGVTGLAQVQLPADSDVRGVRYKVAYDLYYLNHRSLNLDLRIVTATLFKAAGMGPIWLRRLFFLPPPERIAAHFLALVAPPTKSGHSHSV